MNWLWTWGGKSFGYRDGDDLWTSSGGHVGRFNGDVVYGPNGHYLGEVMQDNRLITHPGKRSHRGSSFGTYGRRVGMIPFAAFIGFVMLAGYEDFPSPDSFDPPVSR